MQKSRATIVDFAQVEGVSCPCGEAKRALGSAVDAPLSLHRVAIKLDAAAHHHDRQTEVYYILECGPEARIELDGELFPVRPGLAIHIPPGVRHRAVGTMTILNIVVPPFDPADEHLD